jgi:hypothetical protein
LIWLKLILDTVVKSNMSAEFNVCDIIRFKDRKPHKKSDRLVTKVVGVQLVVFTLLMFFTTMIAFIWGPSLFGLPFDFYTPLYVETQEYLDSAQA